jgi:hypothetical protein
MGMPADLNKWHRILHQVTGDMALNFNKAAGDDLVRWSHRSGSLARYADALRLHVRRAA